MLYDSFDHEGTAVCPYSILMCSVWFAQQMAVIFLNSINWSAFVMGTGGLLWVGTESFKNVCDLCYKGWRFVLMLSFCQGLCFQVGRFLFCVSWPNLSDACYMYLVQFWIQLVFQLERHLWPIWREEASVGALGILFCQVVSCVAYEGAGNFIVTVKSLSLRLLMIYIYIWSTYSWYF